MIYKTLKANKQNGISYWDIICHVEECWVAVFRLFDEGEKYEDGYDNTDLDKLLEDYSERQVASACLKWMRNYAKGKNSLMIWQNCFLDLDCEGEVAFGQLEEMIEDGIITGSNQLREIEEKVNKRGYSIKKGYRYGENDIYYGEYHVSDLIDKYFPCNEKIMIDEDGDEYLACTNCGNCQ